MAKSDYRCCDVCDSKVFYDSELNYEDHRFGKQVLEKPPYRVAGKPQNDERYTDPGFNDKYGWRLDYLGDWAVICIDCAKTHKCVIVPLGEEKQ